MKKHLVLPEFLCVLIFATLQCFRSLQMSILDKDNLSDLSGQWRPAIFQKHHLAYKLATKRVRWFRIYTEANLLVYTGDLSVLCQPEKKEMTLVYLFIYTDGISDSQLMDAHKWMDSGSPSPPGRWLLTDTWQWRCSTSWWKYLRRRFSHQLESDPDKHGCS